MKMKKALTAVTATALSLTMAFAFTACGGDKEKDAVITGITLNETADTTTGASVNVIKEITYSDGTTKTSNDSNITWASDKESVATVNRGYVMGVSQGTADITATYGDIVSHCSVTVHSLEIEITGYSDNVNDDGDVVLEINEELTLGATVKYDGEVVTDAEIEWENSSSQTVTLTGSTIKGFNPGKATITAKYQTVSDTVDVEVLTPAGAAKTTDKEQNKAEANSWGYWHDEGYNWSNTTVADGAVYTEPYREPEEAGYIGAGKVNITFSVDSYGGSKPGPNEAAIQLFYRSAGEQGKLLSNHNYEVTLKLETTASGKVSLNDYRKLPDQYPPEGVEVGEITEGKTDDDYLLDVEAGKVNELTVKFRHGDSGAIYLNGHWDNVESAIQLCLGLLSEPDGEPVKVSVYDIHFKDLGEAQKKWQDNPSNLEGYVEPPITGTEGETFEAVYTADNTAGDTLTDADTWAIWYPTDWGWNCGAPVDMEVSLDPDAKSCTLVFNPNGNENNWGVQLRYLPGDIKDTKIGQMFVVRYTINTTVAYTISLNGKDFALEVGDNEIEYYVTIGSVYTNDQNNQTHDAQCVINGAINNAKHDGEITLVISNLTWTEFTPSEA